jgi:hypothetical protein
MAEKTLLEFSAASIENIRNGPKFPMNNLKFELKPSLINMVQATIFSGNAQEDANAHLQDFLKIGSTIIIKNVDQDIKLLRLFLFSLEGRAKQWFYANKNNMDTWDDYSKAFLQRFFPIGKTNALRRKICNFPEACECF